MTPDFSKLNVKGRLLWLFVMPVLAGFGIDRIIEWIPEPWRWRVTVALAFVAMVWCIRELRWTKRTLRQLEVDGEFFEIAEREGEDW